MSAARKRLEEHAAAEAATAATASLRHENRALLRKLSEEKQRKVDLIRAVYDATHAAVSSMTIDPIPRPKASKGGDHDEVAVAVLSDFQLGKRTPDYDSNVCAKRVQMMADKVVELTEIQRAHHPVRTCRVWLLGDIVEGEFVFAGQPWLIDASLLTQVINGAEIVERFIRQMLANFDTVHVVGVIGNHGQLMGRKGASFNPETNMDRMLYVFVKMLFDRAGEKRVTFNIPRGPGERNWYAIEKLGRYWSMLFHGDQIKGQMGIPYYGFKHKVPGWFSGAIRELREAGPEIRMDAICGHFHVPAEIPLNNIMVRINGTTESSNTFAQEVLASMGDPVQRLMFVHPGKGRVSAEYKVHLLDKDGR